MADIERANGYWRGMCTLAEKVHRGQVTQFGGDPQSMEDLADLLRGLGNLDLSDRLLKAAQAHKGAQLFTKVFAECPAPWGGEECMSCRGDQKGGRRSPFSAPWGGQVHYEALQRSSQGWHEGKHDVLPWFNYLLSTLRIAYREFEDRAGRQRPQKGSKSEIVTYALEEVASPFGIADIERLCPNVSRDTIRLVMNRWREEGRLEPVSRGRDAKWRRLEKR